MKFSWNSLYGGDKRVRTADPLLARQVLSQLSYIPVFVFFVPTENNISYRRSVFFSPTSDL